MEITTKQITLLLKSEMMSKLKINKAQMNAYLEDGMPHYLFGNEYRFLEEEVATWLATYQQERLEREFRDKKGRTIQTYVTEETILKVLRIPKEKLVGLSRKGLPHEKVGVKNFYHIQDILEYSRVVTIAEEKSKHPPKNGSMAKLLKPLCDNVARTVPFIILDGSYDFEKERAGTGLVLIENRDIATGFSNVRNVQTKKPKVVIQYVGHFDTGNKNPFYIKAHQLSRKYHNGKHRM